ncbi:MAG TPA: alkaline phosphatase family protein [Oligoflexia bacterium]|nr:alkaline phosphatase family protein [Oligoflexia bacterium]HMP48440.1 alkaline phosphatase family protein [Oligoflexia bacterium]
MRNETSIDAVRLSELKSSKGNLLRLPLYDSFCFSKIGTLNYNLLELSISKSSPDYNKLNEGSRQALKSNPLFSCLPEKKCSRLFDSPSGNSLTIFHSLIDSFGWVFLEELYDEINCIRILEDEGVLSLLTSQFPSTTTAHVTTMNTGLPVYDHGLYEWFIFDPVVDDVICPLLFSELDPLERGSLLNKRGVSAKKAFRLQQPTFYEKLSKIDVNSYLVQPAEYAPSVYDDELTRGATSLRYNNLEGAFKSIREIIESGESGTCTPRTSYIYFYYGVIDSVAHEHGPLSREHRDACVYFFKIFEKELLKTLLDSKNCISLMTADHGQKRVKPENTLYLDEEFPELLNFLKKNENGKLVAPVGSPVDLFLHLSEECKDRMPSGLREILLKISEHSEMFSRDELIELGVFGKNQSDLFLSRLGDILFLPDEDGSIWFRNGSKKGVHIGQHGGLTPEEMEVPLFCF